MHADPLSVAAFARRVLIVIGLVVLTLFLWRIVDALLLAFGAVLVAVLLRGGAAPLARWTKLPEGLAIPLVALAVALGLGIVVWIAGAEVRAQVADLSERVPRSWAQLRERLGDLPLGDDLIDRVRGETPDVSGMVSSATGMATSAAGALGNLILVLFGGLYFASQPRLYRDGLVRLTPQGSRGELHATFDACGTALRRWLLGQLLAMTVAAVLTTLGLWLLGMPGFLALGLLAGLAEFVPVVGSILAAVPALLLALTHGGTEMLLWTLLLYVGVQQLQGNVIAPLVMHQLVSLPPALTLFAILAFALVFGPLGVLFAAPLAVVTFVAVRQLWIKEALGDSKILASKAEAAGKS